MESNVLGISLNRLAINYGKLLKPAEKEAYKNLYLQYFKNVPDKEWMFAIETYIRNPDHKRLPTVAELSINLPQAKPIEQIACNACNHGLRSIAEKSKFGYWAAVTYACTCEAGKRYTAPALWQCAGCPAFIPFELPQDKSALLKSEAYRVYQETKQMSPACRAYDFHSHNVNCLRWKKRLAEEAETKKPLNVSRILNAEPDVEESQIPF